MPNTDDKTIRMMQPEEMPRYNMPPIPSGPRKKKKSSGTGKIVALGALGIVAGVAGAAGISAYTTSKNPETSLKPDVDADHDMGMETGADSHSGGGSGSAGANGAGGNLENVRSQGSLIDVPDLGDIQYASSPRDNMSFNDAFAHARAEVGPHGVFEWRGGVYGTYYREEWNSLPESYREQFSNHDWSHLIEHGVDDFEWEVELPSITYEPNGREVIILRDAFTGEKIYYYPGSSVTPVLDEYGQVIGIVDTSAIDEAQSTGSMLAILPSGEAQVVEDPHGLLSEFVVYDPDGEVVMPEFVDEIDGQDYKDIVAVVSEDDSDFGDGVVMASAVDEDPIILDLDYDVEIAEVMGEDLELPPAAIELPESIDEGYEAGLYETGADANVGGCEEIALNDINDPVQDSFDDQLFNDYSI